MQFPPCAKQGQSIGPDLLCFIRTTSSCSIGIIFGTLGLYSHAWGTASSSHQLQLLHPLKNKMKRKTDHIWTIKKEKSGSEKQCNLRGKKCVIEDDQRKILLLKKKKERLVMSTLRQCNSSCMWIPSNIQKRAHCYSPAWWHFISSGSPMQKTPCFW